MMHRIRQTRESKGFTRDHLASLTGIHSRTIFNYEKDISSPRLVDLQTISSALGVRLVDLIVPEQLLPLSAA